MMFAVFFVIAFLNGIMNAKVRKEQQLAVEGEQRANALYVLIKALSESKGVEGLVKIACEEIRNQFGIDARILVYNENGKLQSTSIPMDEQLLKQIPGIPDKQDITEHASGHLKLAKGRLPGFCCPVSKCTRVMW